jgi:uncharacterized protein YggU (UPF0235/DUF167 family)
MILQAIIKTKKKQDSILWDGESLIICIKEVAIEGRANKYLLQYLADFFETKVYNLEIVDTTLFATKKLIKINLEEIEIRNKLDSIRVDSLF